LNGESAGHDSNLRQRFVRSKKKFGPASNDRTHTSGWKCLDVGLDIFNNLENHAVVPIERTLNRVSAQAEPLGRLLRALNTNILSQGVDVVVIPVRLNTVDSRNNVWKKFLDGA